MVIATTVDYQIDINESPGIVRSSYIQEQEPQSSFGNSSLYSYIQDILKSSPLLVVAPTVQHCKYRIVVLANY